MTLISVFSMMLLALGLDHRPHLWHFNPDPVNAYGEPWECVVGGERRATPPYVWGS